MKSGARADVGMTHDDRRVRAPDCWQSGLLDRDRTYLIGKAGFNRWRGVMHTFVPWDSVRFQRVLVFLCRKRSALRSLKCANT
jgi:hypothetical protein